MSDEKHYLTSNIDAHNLDTETINKIKRMKH
jgi:hypothetical protein